MAARSKMSGVPQFNFYSQIIFILFLFFYTATATVTNSVFYFHYNFGLFDQNIFYYLYFFANGSIYVVFLLSILFLFQNTPSSIFRTFVLISLFIYVFLAAGLYVASLSNFGWNFDVNPIDLVTFLARAAVLNFVLHAAMPRKNVELKRFQIFRNSVIASFSLGVIAVPIWSYLNPLIMTYQAERVAVNDHYCLLVSELAGEEYHSVTQRKQLEGLRMQARSLHSGLVFNFHAVMWVFREAKPEPYNWSYKYQGFEKISKYTETALGLPPVCEGRANFLAHLK